MKILLWDIETLPMEVYTWTLYPEHLSHDNILQETSIACASWKWLGEREIFHAEISPSNPREDRGVIKILHGVLSEADVIVAHNGDQFDLRKFNARAIYWGWAPIPPIKTIDTKKVAKRYFGFDSNRLDYLGQYLLGKGKIHVDFELWKQILLGDPKALQKMIAYNMEDVRILEQVYLRMRPYMQGHPNMALESPGEIVCPVCASPRWQSRGTRLNLTTMNERFQCQDCGKWFCSTKMIGKAMVKG